MAVARWKDLCVDTGQTETLGRFYAAALGLRFEPDEGAGALAGPDPGQRVWMNVVPEPKTTKQRVHLDVVCGAVDDLVALGATVLEPQADYPDRSWTVLADPEGGEMCAFVREPAELPTYRLSELVVDCTAPRPVATWWAEVLGARVDGRADKDWWWLVDVPDLPFPNWVFVRVPEPKSVKNRIHWDVATSSVDAMVDAGATVLRGPTADDEWQVLADPEGNEFCAFVRARD
ncbi:MAG: VOC family protein [Sciscionella sp.]